MSASSGQLLIPVGRNRPGLSPGPLVVSLALLLIAVVGAVVLGAARLPVSGVLADLADRLPFIDIDSGLDARQQAVLWQIRLPRVALAALVGGTLAMAGGAYQGVFRNPLADPYLLGVAAGAGLGATVVIVAGGGRGLLLTFAAFVGGLTAVVATYVLGRAGGRRQSTATLILAGVAIASFFTALQTFVQQLGSDTVREVFAWILGRLATAGWSEVTLIAPFTAVMAVVLWLHRRHLDVLSVGEEEAETLGITTDRVRIIVVLAATLGTAAAVSVSGLIGFVGIVVPHTVRLLTRSSYRYVLPVSLIGGGAFLVAADLAARTVIAPAELPVGIITAFVGAPFFILVLRSVFGDRS